RVLVMSSAPGRIKQSIPIPFERPRTLMSLRRTPEFNRITQEIWDLLRDEVERARAQEAGRVTAKSTIKIDAASAG
ncbi:MAG: hypothetical protein ACKVQT_36740, partial [Burkholderiales bacterium]